MIIGICGKSGSGKSTIAKMIIDKYKDRVIHLDIDKIGHKVETFDDVKSKLVASFGESILINGEVDRKKLGQIVFSSQLMMEILTDITYPAMIEEIDKIINENQEKIIILDWLLLPKTKYFLTCDIRILLDIPYAIRLNRCLKRDNITKEKFDLRDKNSFNYDGYDFDYIIKNEETEVKRLVKIL